MQGVKDVEEVLAWWAFASRKRVREICEELCIFFELRPEGLHRQLIICWDRDLTDVSLLHEHLLPAQHVLEEVLVDDVIVREVVLHC